jgi:hypothetical protein
VTDAVRQDGGHSPSLYVGGPVDDVVNKLGSDCVPDPQVIGGGSSDPQACTRPVLWAAGFGRVPRVAYALGLVPTPTQTCCGPITDGNSAVFGMLCLTPDNTGYDAQFIPIEGGPPRCGMFDFNLVARDGTRVGDQGPFRACTNDPRTHSYYFRTGTMGGDAKLQLLLRSGDDFGKTEWQQGCSTSRLEPAPRDGGAGGDGGVGGDGGAGGDGGMPPGPGDRRPPSTTATVSPPPNAAGWNRTHVTVAFRAVDAGAMATGVRAIHVRLSGAEDRTEVLPGPGGPVSVRAQGTTHVSYFAMDRAGNVEANKSMTLRIDKTPPTIAGMPGCPCTLWPPNDELVEVASVRASDTPSGLARFELDVDSNERSRSGEPDVVVTGSGFDPRTVELRAERPHHGCKRRYEITASATDIAGNSTSATVTCKVAHDRRDRP